MDRLRRFLKYPFRFQCAVGEALLRLLLVSLLVRLLPAARVCRMWIHSKPARRTSSGSLSAEEICRAVTTASRYVTGATCLPQSVVGRAMLQRAGYPAEIKIGVAKTPPGFEAHAWVDSGGVVVLGESITQYAELPTKR